MSKIVALDYGLKRIGVAISDARQSIAFPLGVVEGGKKELENVKKMLQKEDIELIVIGYPLLLNGKKGDMAIQVEHFANKLSLYLKIPFFLLDERLSSKQADRSLQELSMTRKKRQEKLDMTTAVLLLQLYLEIKKRGPHAR